MATKPIAGLGYFAPKTYKAGQILGYFQGAPVENDSQYSLTFGRKKIEPTGKLKRLNHSCMPNAAFRGRWLVALASIGAGWEITIDYLATERKISHPFMCSCGMPNCRGRIG
jgi:SET domain-containing protein